MKKSLYTRLKEAYTAENLNKITKMILDLYKRKQYHYLLSLLKKIDSSIEIEEGKNSRILARLMMLYHPDKLNHYLQDIEKYHEAGQTEKLKEFEHIFSVTDLKAPQFEDVVDPDASFTPQYEWEESHIDYSYQSSSELEYEDEFYMDFTSDCTSHSFYEVMKRSVYGALNIELPHLLLEDMDELELTAWGMDSLEGIEYCKHLEWLDLSNNKLIDITELGNLEFLRYLYLADNEIGYIDSLSNLMHLKALDLSGNEIDDISPLFELEYLEYVNLLGNKVPNEQLCLLRTKGIIVVY